MKVLLIDPPGYQEGINLGLAYLVSALKKANHKVKILDLNNLKTEAEKRLFHSLDERPDVVGISIKLFTLEEAKKIIKKARDYYRATYVAGGPHITIEQGEVFEEIPELDILVVGEGEESFVNLCNSLEKKQEVKSGKGILLKKDKKRKISPEFIDDLGELPFPDFSAFEQNKKLREKILNLLSAYPLITSRGCPYGCIYCSVGNVSGKRWRARSVDSVIKELSLMKKKYDIKQFRILDDNSTQDLSRIKKLCKALIKEKLNLRWYCPNGIRIEKIDSKTARLMNEAGCYSIMVGIESGNSQVFDNINKGTSLKSITKGIKTIRKAGIKVGGFFIIGLPGSTFEIEVESINFVKEIRLDSSFWGMLVPYPGTSLWEWIKAKEKKGEVRVLRDYREGFHFGGIPPCIFDTKEFPEVERKKIYVISCLRSWKINLVKKPGENLNAFQLLWKFFSLVWEYDRKRVGVYFKELLFFRGHQYLILKFKHKM